MVKSRDNIKRLYLLFGDTKLLRKHSKKIFLFLVITILSLNIPDFKGFRGKAYDVLVSAYSVCSYPMHWVQNQCSELKNYIFMLTNTRDIYLENQRLKEKLQNLELTEVENRDLRQLLNFQDNFTFSKITGRVVLESHDNFRNHYLLNIGMQNGVQKGNAIVAHNRLIGRVTDTSDRSSKMQLLTDKDSKIPVSILNTHYWGVATGLDRDRYLKLLYLTDESDIEDGQVVVTSGEGGYIPHGIYVGEIVKREEGIYIEICPSARKKLALVSVLRLKEGFANANAQK